MSGTSRKYQQFFYAIFPICLKVYPAPIMHFCKIKLTTPLLPFSLKNDMLKIKNKWALPERKRPAKPQNIETKGSVVEMVKLIMGLKGSGKTKKLVDLVRKAVDEGNGDVVVIEKERKLTYDIPYQARLIDAGTYDVGTYEFLKGLICGIHAGNYDITHFYIDNFYKLVGDKSEDALAAFISWLDGFAEAEKIEFFISVSADPETVPEALKKFLL